jgi:V/A-type H+-transporting ATPase subunit A
MSIGSVVRVNGPVVQVEGMEASMLEYVEIGPLRLPGEVIALETDAATVQVYEYTGGLRPGDPAVPTGMPLAAELGPGLLGSVLDGIGRPLRRLGDLTGHFIEPGTTVPTIDRGLRFRFTPVCTAGDRVEPGDVLGTIEERGGFILKVLMPPGEAGVVRSVHAGEVTPIDPVVELDSGASISATQRWPVRRPRPAAGRIAATRPFLTGSECWTSSFPSPRAVPWRCQAASAPARRCSSRRSPSSPKRTWSSTSAAASAATRWRRSFTTFRR